MNRLEYCMAKTLMQPSFEIKVRNAGVYRFPPAYRFENHNHREMEINCINHGSCIMGINGIFLPLKRGDCLAVYSGIPHQFIVDTRENCRITQLEFTIKGTEGLKDDLPFLRDDLEYQKLSGCESVNYAMENICRIFRAAKEEEEKEALLHLSFFQLFIELSGKIEGQCKGKTRKGKAGRISEIISYINENCEKEINIEELAKKYGVSSRYIRKCFQQETGMSCQKYICTLRIGKAKELLWFTSKSATEIAHETGFGRSQYFCRVFQQYTEMTPLEYRNLSRGQKAEELCIIDF